jgi:folylpolyglutamate synthase/dihydropteroate synthase
MPSPIKTIKITIVSQSDQTNNPITSLIFALISSLQDKDIKSMIDIVTPLIDEWLLPPLQVNLYNQH